MPCRWGGVAAPSSASGPRPSRIGSGTLAIVLLAVALVPFVQDLTAQPAIRYAQTAAMVDRGTIQLDAYERVVGVDKVVRDGHIYGDKAPLQPVVAMPVYRLARSGAGDRRRHGIVGLSVFGAFLVLQSAWVNPWGGEAPGPRYIIPALPFLIIGMAEAWNRAPRFQWVAVRWSVLAMSMTVIADHLTAAGNYAVIAQLQGLRDNGPVESLWTLLLGPVGMAVHAATVIVAAWYLVAAVRSEQAARGEAGAPLPPLEQHHADVAL